MNKSHLLPIIVFIAVLSCCLGACGKVSSPVPYEGSGYPHSYPYR